MKIRIKYEIFQCLNSPTKTDDTDDFFCHLKEINMWCSSQMLHNFWIVHHIRVTIPDFTFNSFICSRISVLVHSFICSRIRLLVHIPMFEDNFLKSIFWFHVLQIFFIIHMIWINFPLFLSFFMLLGYKTTDLYMGYFQSVFTTFQSKLTKSNFPYFNQKFQIFVPL